MGSRRTTEEKALDRRHNEAARRESVVDDRRRGVTRNLEEALRLQGQAEEFARAFRLTRETRGE